MSHSHNIVDGGCIHHGPVGTHHDHGTIGNNSNHGPGTVAAPIHTPVVGTVPGDHGADWTHQHDMGFGGWNHETIITNPQNVQHFNHSNHPSSGPIVLS